MDEKRAFPRLHTALLVLLVAVVGLLYLLADESPAPDGALPVTAQIEPAGEEVSEDPTRDAVEAAEDAAQDAAGAADEDAVTEAAEDPIWLDEETVQTDPVAVAGTDELEPTELPMEAETEPVAASPVQEVAVQPVSVPEPEPEPEPTIAAVEPVVALPSGARNSNWLLQQNPEYFTLQLVTVSSPESAASFVARQREPAEFTVYQLQRDGRILHVVLYGLFSSRAAAEEAADNLPSEVGRVQPWIRPVGQVQAAARLSTLN